MKKTNLALLLILIFFSCSNKKNEQLRISHVNLSHCKSSNKDYIPLDLQYAMLLDNNMGNYVVELNNNYLEKNPKISHFLVYQNENGIDTFNIFSHSDWEINKNDVNYGSFYLLKSDLRKKYQLSKGIKSGEYLKSILENSVIYYTNKTADEFRIINGKQYKIIKEFTHSFKKDKYEITYQAKDCR